MATNAEQKIAEAAQTQPLPRQPIDEATVNHNFMMLGDAEFQYDKTAGQHGAFLLADFAPIFLYRGGDNILFEAGFDTTLQNGSNGSDHDSGSSTSFDLSFAQLDYVMNDYMTFAAGDLLLPLGTYTERSAGWLNKIPDDPLAVDALIPGSGVGVELRGAVPLGDDGKFVNYSGVWRERAKFGGRDRRCRRSWIWAGTWVSGPTAWWRICTATRPAARGWECFYHSRTNPITIWNWESPANRVNGMMRGLTSGRRVCLMRPCIWGLILRRRVSIS